ncbi:MAG: hypothetical protein BGN88_07785, partial [Clostridiales bacterium 43-6]
VKAKDVFDVAAKKTGAMISIQKLRVNVAKLNSQISKSYEALGRLVYDSKKSEENVDEAVAALIAEIEQKYEEIADIEVKIAITKGKAFCPSCLTENDNAATFCSKCGEKLNKE